MIWNEIVYCKGYWVSDTGAVKSPRKILKPVDNGNGYLGVSLPVNNKILRKYIHRLVAEAFIDNPENKKTVNHINGIKSDNSVENLQWATQSENNYHSYEIGLKNVFGDRNPSVKIKERDRKYIYYSYHYGEVSIKDLSLYFDVHPQTIRRYIV